jgi:DNA-binding CsgD family transcriptional regulator/tetratricopeptide (TPR) repeat protein
VAGPSTELIGRDDLVQQVQAILAAPGSGGVTLVGPAGIGKSRLAHEVADRQPPGVVVRRITATAATSDIPLGALAPFLPPDAGAFGLPALLLVRHGLVEGAQDQRLLLVVDDAPHLDEASAALVHQLAVSGEARVLATQRTGVPAPDSVTRLWRDGVLVRLELGPLGPDAVAALAATVLGGAVEARSARLLGERSDGNPLYAHELLQATLEAGEWIDGPDGWRWEVGSAPSPRLTDLLSDRLDALDDEQREALALLAFGEPLGLVELTSVASEAAIDALEQRDLVTAELDGRRLKVRFSHPLHAEVVRRGVNPLRARRVRATLVEVLTQTGARRREDDLRLATLALDGGVEVSVDVLHRAARAALFASDLDLARRLGQEAFSRQPDFETGRALADALYEQGHVATIEDHVARWAPLARSDGDRAVVWLLQAVTAFYRAGDAAGAFAVLDAAGDALPPGSWRDEVTGLRATLLMMSGRHHEALALAEPLLVDRGLDRVLVQATLAATQALHCLGRGAESLAAADRAIAAYEVLGPQATLVSSSVLGMVRCSSLVDLGQLDAALAAGDAARDAALRTGDATTEGLAELVRSDALGLRGRLTDALLAARRAEAAFVRLAHTPFRRWAIEQRAVVTTLANDRAGLDAALADLASLGDHPARLFEHAEVIARAWQAHWDDRPTQAERILVDGARRLDERGERTGAARCWYELVRLGRADAATGPLAALVDHLEGTFAPALLAHAEAAESGDAAALGRAADGLAEVGALVLAVGAGAQAVEACVAAGDQRAAARWSEQVAAWSARCQQVEAPAVATAAPPPLTRREREVALLAAQGLASRAIADRLFLSSRTVDNHLSRSYEKLGVRSRAELAHVLAPA